MFVFLFCVWPLCLAFIKVLLLSEPFIFLFHCVSSVTSLKAIWWVWKQDGGSSFFSSFLLGSGVGISRGAVWLFLEAEQWTSPFLPEDGDWEGFIHFNLLIFFGGSSPMKVIWSPLFEMVFPGQGALNLYSKSEKWFGWRAQTTEGKGSLPPRWYTLPWPVCPR